MTNEINYDPKVGITLYLNGTAAGGRYTCIGSNNFKTEELIIPMTYKRIRNYFSLSNSIQVLPILM